MHPLARDAEKVGDLSEREAGRPCLGQELADLAQGALVFLLCR
jgi:hypothetical protein